MDSSSLLLAAALLVLPAPWAQAGSMYKCADAKGRIAFSDTPCPGDMQVKAQYEVADPETPEQSAARLAADSQRLRAADRAFRARHAQRSRELDYQLQLGAQRDARLRAAAANDTSERSPTYAERPSREDMRRAKVSR